MWALVLLAFNQKRWKLRKPSLEIKNFSEYSVWLRVEESMNRNHSGKLMTDQNCCVRWLYIRFSASGIEGNFCTFPSQGFPYICSPIAHRRLSLKSDAKSWKSFYQVFLCERYGHVSLFTSASQLPHPDIPIPRSVQVSENWVKPGEFPVFTDLRKKDFPSKTENKNIWLSYLLKWSLWKAFDENWDF